MKNGAALAQQWHRNDEKVHSQSHTESSKLGVTSSEKCETKTEADWI